MLLDNKKVLCTTMGYVLREFGFHLQVFQLQHGLNDLEFNLLEMHFIWASTIRAKKCSVPSIAQAALKNVSSFYKDKGCFELLLFFSIYNENANLMFSFKIICEVLGFYL